MVPISIVLVVLWWSADYLIVKTLKKRKKRNSGFPPAVQAEKSVACAEKSEESASTKSWTAETQAENGATAKKRWQRIHSNKLRSALDLVALDRFQISDKAIGTIVLIVFLLYPSVCKQTFKMLQCDRMHHPVETKDPTGALFRSFLRQDHQIECFSDLHVTTLLGLGLPVLILITFGVPVIMGVIIFRSKDLMSSRRGRLRYMMLTTGYQRKYMWWESVTMIRKAMIAGISVFYADPADLDKQLVFGMGVCALFLCLHVVYHPFEKIKIKDELTGKTTEVGLTQNLETGALILNTTTLYLGEVMMLGLNSDVLMMLLSLLLVLINMAFIFFAASKYMQLKIHETPALGKRWDRLRSKFCFKKTKKEAGGGGSTTEVVPVDAGGEEEKSEQNNAHEDVQNVETAE
jgi:hypothetical protein